MGLELWVTCARSRVSFVPRVTSPSHYTEQSRKAPPPTYRAAIFFRDEADPRPAVTEATSRSRD